MRTLLAVTTLALLAVASNTAYGSSITLNVNGTLVDGAVLGGTMTIDQNSGLITAIDLTLGRPDTGTFDVFAGQFATGSVIDTGATLTGQSAGSYPGITLLLPVTSLVGYTGGPLCSVNALCNGSETSGLLQNATDEGNSLHHLNTGSLTPMPTSIPEPASLALLGFGIATLVAMRRFAGDSKRA